MKKFTILICFLALYLDANIPLDNLIEFDKTTCLQRLETADDSELWDVFLKGQTKLFFDSEFQWVADKIWWQKPKRITEFGSGNGAYLSELANRFHEKTFQGIEKLPSFVEKANENYATNNLSFCEGDAEIFNTQLTGSADIVLFRFTLQHLKDPVIALKNAAKYLSSNGCVIIIDTYDKARRASHPITSINNALELVAESQEKKESGNRKISLDLLQTFEIEDSPLNELYELYFSNIDMAGNVLSEVVRFEGERDRKLFFNHGLLFITLLQRTYKIPVDLDTAYNELKEYLEDKDAWISLGMHYMILKKR